jgi:hypothetical protein
MELVFGSVLNTAYQLTDDKQEFESYIQPKLAYTKELTNSGITVLSNGLLFETDIKQALPKAETQYVDFPKFFKSDTTDFLGYDLFAMVFYFATRYEECVVSEKDKHQRFQAENSLAFQYNCLHFPFLNNAIQDFASKL